jgi:hypothetical protein
MSSPRDRDPDLRLERLGDREGYHRAHLGEAAQVRTLEVSTRTVEKFSAAYRALIDAVFTAPGAAEWLSGLRKRVAAMLAERNATGHHAVSRDAFRPANSGSGRL